MKALSKTLILIVSIILLFIGMLTNIFASENKDTSYTRCIVQLKDSVDKDKVIGLAKAFSVRSNASIKNIYKHSIKGFTINIPCHAAHAVFGDSEFVESMESDAIITMYPRGGNPDKGGKPKDTEPEEDTQVLSYGTTRVGGSLDGTGKTAWVIDSGVDLDHPDLNIDRSRAFSTIKNSANDENGHGTHVAGIIGAIDNTIGTVGVAPNTLIVPIRVLDRRGSGSLSGVIAGVDYVSEKASAGDCVNMSLGGGISTSLDAAVKNASEKTKAYFSLAAGNESAHASNHSPARANGNYIFTISAIDKYDVYATYSNYGNPPVDYAAPGTSIVSLWKNNGTKTISGTSMAAPHACAVLMLTNGVPSTSGFVKNDPDSNVDLIISH